jgi:hypothetical protein
MSTRKSTEPRRPRYSELKCARSVGRTTATQICVDKRKGSPTGMHVNQAQAYHLLSNLANIQKPSTLILEPAVDKRQCRTVSTVQGVSSDMHQ